MKIIMLILISLVLYFYVKDDVKKENLMYKEISEKKVLDLHVDITTPSGIVSKKVTQEPMDLVSPHLYIQSKEEVEHIFKEYDKAEQEMILSWKEEDAYRQKQKFITKMKKIKQKKEENE